MRNSHLKNANTKRISELQKEIRAIDKEIDRRSYCRERTR